MKLISASLFLLYSFISWVFKELEQEHRRRGTCHYRKRGGEERERERETETETERQREREEGGRERERKKGREREGE